MKTRFTKGQTIYRIHMNWKYEYDNATDTATTWMGITEEVVESCGQKRLLLYNDSGRYFKQFHPNQEAGYVTKMCATFHATLEEAEKEMDEYINFHNNKKQGNRTILIKKIS